MRRKLDSECPVQIQYKQYNYYDRIEIVRGRRVRKLWLDITPLHSILVQPVCGYHDPDLLPDYDNETYLGETIRFYIVTLSMTRKCVQSYRSVVDTGECIYKLG